MPNAPDLASLGIRVATLEAEMLRTRDRLHKDADMLMGHEGTIEQFKETMADRRQDIAEHQREWERRFQALVDDLRRRDADRDTRAENHAVTGMESHVSWAMLKYFVMAIVGTATLTATAIVWLFHALGKI